VNIYVRLFMDISCFVVCVSVAFLVLWTLIEKQSDGGNF
jgi:hypothetical protein